MDNNFNLNIIAMLCKQISANINRDMTDYEREYVEAMYMQLISKLSGRINNKALILLSNKLSDKLSSNHNYNKKNDFRDFQNRQILDMEEKDHEIKMDDIEITGLFGLTSLSDISRIFNPIISYSKNYIAFDSFNRDVSSINTLKWNYASIMNTASGNVSTNDEIRSIISIKLYQPSIPTSFVNTNTNRISFLIEEFSANSYIASSNRRYHFLSRVNTNLNNNRFCECQTEGYADGEFKFRKPITHLSSLTISLGDPTVEIPFPNDRSYGTISDNGTLLTLTCETKHGLTANDRVFIYNFIPSHASHTNDFITLITNPLGIVVSSVTDDYIVTFNISTGSVVFSGRALIYFGNTRVIFAMEFTYISEN